MRCFDTCTHNLRRSWHLWPRKCSTLGPPAKPSANPFLPPCPVWPKWLQNPSLTGTLGRCAVGPDIVKSADPNKHHHPLTLARFASHTGGQLSRLCLRQVARREWRTRLPCSCKFCATKNSSYKTPAIRRFTVRAKKPGEPPIRKDEHPD